MATAPVDAKRIEVSLRILAAIIADGPSPDDSPYWPVFEGLEDELGKLVKKRSRLMHYLPDSAGRDLSSKR